MIKNNLHLLSLYVSFLRHILLNTFKKPISDLNEVLLLNNSVKKYNFSFRKIEKDIEQNIAKGGESNKRRAHSFEWS